MRYAARLRIVECDVWRRKGEVAVEHVARGHGEVLLMSLRCVVRSKFSEEEELLLARKNMWNINRAAYVEAELIEDKLRDWARSGIRVRPGIDGCVLGNTPKGYREIDARHSSW